MQHLFFIIYYYYFFIILIITKTTIICICRITIAFGWFATPRWHIHYAGQKYGLFWGDLLQARANLLRTWQVCCGYSNDMCVSFIRPKKIRGQICGVVGKSSITSYQTNHQKCGCISRKNVEHFFLFIQTSINKVSSLCTGNVRCLL